jgi:hypothetical protein
VGPFGTSATNRPVVPTPNDYDDGEIGGMIGRGNRSTRRKPARVPLCPPQTPHGLPGREPGPPRWEASDILSVSSLSASCSVHIVTRNSQDINAHAEGIHSTPYGKKQNHGDISKVTSEKKLKPNSTIVSSFYST